MENNEKWLFGSDILFEWPMANLLFYCRIERKWLLKKKLAKIALKSKLSWKFQCSMLLIEVAKCQKIVDFIKFQSKWIILKHFTSPKQHVVLRKLFSHPSDKNSSLLWNKNFHTVIYSNIQICASQLLWECSSWASRNGAVRKIFLTPP